MPLHRLEHDSSSSSSSDSDSSLLSREPAKKKKNAQKKKKGKKATDQSSDSEKPNTAKPKPAKADSEKADDDYRAAARAVTRCVDMFCKPSKVIETILNLADEEASKHGDLEEDELERGARQRCLQELSPETLDRYKCAYQLFIRLAPQLKTLVNDTSKNKELRRVISLMNKTVSTTRADDTARLKDKIGHYAAPNPAVAALAPPVYTGSGSRSNMGLNHPVLARFLCPINSLLSYDEDPESGRQKLMSGKIKMSPKIYPTFFWAGNPPGQDYDANNVFSGLFHGYLLERVIRHIFTGPSTSLGEDSRGTRQCNAELHNMAKVEAAHIAYACVLARFGISDKNRWSEKDGAFSYRVFYYTILHQIDKCEDDAWKTALFKHFNMVLFKDPNGRLATTERAEDGSDNENDSEGDDSFLTMMRAQASARVVTVKRTSSSTDEIAAGQATPPPSSPRQPRVPVGPTTTITESGSATTITIINTVPASPVRLSVAISTPPPRQRVPDASPTGRSDLTELSNIGSPDPPAGHSKESSAGASGSAKRKATVVSDMEQGTNEAPVKNKVARQPKGNRKAVACSVSEDPAPAVDGPNGKAKQGRTRRRKSKN